MCRLPSIIILEDYGIARIYRCTGQSYRYPFLQMGTDGKTWSIAPFIARLCETGVAGWKLPLIALLTDRDEVAKSDESKTAYQLLEPHWESLGFVCGEPTVDEITAYKAGSGTLTDDTKIIEHLKIKNIYGMIKIYKEIILMLRSVTDVRITAYRLEVWLSYTYPANTVARTN